MLVSGLPALDPVTLVFSISLLGLLSAGVAAGFARAMPRQRTALQLWSRAMAACGVAFGLLFLRGHVPWWLGFLVPNTLVFVTTWFCLQAHAVLLEVRMPVARTMVLSALGLSGVLVSFVTRQPSSMAAFTLALALALLLGQVAAMVVRQSSRRPSPAEILSALTFAGMALGFALRAVLTVVQGVAAVVPTAGGPVQTFTLAMGAAFIAVSSLSFIALAQERQRRALEEHARRDALTGLYNRAALAALARELDAGAAPFSVVMLDIDHFKDFNDTYGHPMGDVAITHVAHFLADSVRISDVVCRYGGEEYCVVLRQSSAADAARFAQRAVEGLARSAVPLPGRRVGITLSAGYATRAHAGEPLSAVLERADHALYRAKNAGRNRAMGAADVPCATPT